MITRLSYIALLLAVFIVVYSAPSGGPFGSNRGGPGSGGIGPIFVSRSPGMGFGSSSRGPGMGFGSSSREPGMGFGSSSRGPGMGFGSSSRGPGMGFGSSTRDPGNIRPGGPHPGFDNEEFRDLVVSKICANQSVAQAFLTEMQELLARLQSDQSFTQVLADRAQIVAYIQSSINAALLSSDCTAYFNGLKSAAEADRAVIAARLEPYRNVADAVMQIMRKILGGPRF